MKITCGLDNIKEFNQQLRLNIPEVIPVIKNLMNAGMLQGLRGAVLLTGDEYEKSHAKRPGINVSPCCGTCKAYDPDPNFTNHGRCNKGKRLAINTFYNREPCNGFF